MSKTVLIFFMGFVLTACNLTAEPATTTLPDTAPPEQSESPTNTVIPATNTPVMPTMTQVIQQIPTSSFNAIYVGTSTPLPIGVRAPTQPGGLSDQLTPLPINGQTPTVNTSSQDIPFPEEFNDRYEVNTAQGRTLYVNYEVVVNNPGIGRVFIEVRDPTGAVIAQLIVTETTTDELEVLIETSGTHLVLATSQNLRGFYSISYGTR